MVITTGLQPSFSDDIYNQLVAGAIKKTAVNKLVKGQHMP